MSYHHLVEIHAHLANLCTESFGGAIGDALGEALETVMCSPNFPPWRRRVEKAAALRSARRKDWVHLRETLQWIIALARVAERSDDSTIHVQKLCSAALQRVRQKLRVRKSRSKRRPASRLDK